MLRVHLALVHVDFVCLFIAHGHVLSLNVLSEVLEVIFQLEDCVISHMKIFREFLFDLFSHVLFHQVVVIFERSKFTIGDIELINDLITLGTHL